MDIGLDRTTNLKIISFFSSDYTTNILLINDMHIYIVVFFQIFFT